LANVDLLFTFHDPDINLNKEKRKYPYENLYIDSKEIFQKNLTLGDYRQDYDSRKWKNWVTSQITKMPRWFLFTEPPTAIL